MSLKRPLPSDLAIAADFRTAPYGNYTGTVRKKYNLDIITTAQVLFTVLQKQMEK